MTDAESLEQWQTNTEISTAELDQMVIAMNDAWSDYEAKKKISTEAHDKYEEKERLVLNALKTTNKKKYFVDGLGTVSRVEKMVVTTPKSAEDKWKLLKYIEDKYGVETRDGYISINHQSTNSFYNQEYEIAVKEGRLDFKVPGLPEPTVKESIRFLGSKK